jgi:hypothetical protein
MPRIGKCRAQRLPTPCLALEIFIDVLAASAIVFKTTGKLAWDAVIAATQHRLRPILLTAAAAILGMIPIAPTVFWGPMAYAVMGGLVVATLLTLVFLPALYVAWFRIQPVDLPIGTQENSPQAPECRRAVGAYLPSAVKLGWRASKLSLALEALAMQWRRRVFTSPR